MKYRVIFGHVSHILKSDTSSNHQIAAVFCISNDAESSKYTEKHYIKIHHTQLSLGCE